MGTLRETEWNELGRFRVATQGLKACTLCLKFWEDGAEEGFRRCSMDRKRISGIDRRKGFERRNTDRLIKLMLNDWYACHGQGD